MDYLVKRDLSNLYIRGGRFGRVMVTVCSYWVNWVNRYLRFSGRGDLYIFFATLKFRIVSIEDVAAGGCE
jgi:hypothetical protein